MKLFFIKHQTRINTLFSLIIMVCIFYSSILGERISEIYTNFVIDGITTNNLFITLGIMVDLKNDALVQENKTNLNDQIKKFNEKWDKAENEIKMKKAVKPPLDFTIFALLTLQIIFNIFVSEKKTLAKMPQVILETTAKRPLY